MDINESVKTQDMPVSRRKEADRLFLYHGDLFFAHQLSQSLLSENSVLMVKNIGDGNSEQNFSLIRSMGI